jgi:hypothetical protein
MTTLKLPLSGMERDARRRIARCRDARETEFVVSRPVHAHTMFDYVAAYKLIATVRVPVLPARRSRVRQ